MLRAKSIPAFLEQANTDGMRATMLLQVWLRCGILVLERVLAVLLYLADRP